MVTPSCGFQSGQPPNDSAHAVVPVAMMVAATTIREKRMRIVNLQNLGWEAKIRPTCLRFWSF